MLSTHLKLATRLYINREDLDFTSVNDVEATQELDLVEDFHGAVGTPIGSSFHRLDALKYILTIS